MKRVVIPISDDTEVGSAIASLNAQIPEFARNSQEYAVLYPRVVATIEDLSGKVKQIARTGTTVHVNKEFNFPDFVVSVVVDYPRRAGLLEKLVGLFRRAR
jgi:hypothetical protein